MKKIVPFIISIAVCGAVSTTAMASEIIVSPLDSRPVSTEYLSDLAEIAGDNVIVAGEGNLDYFDSTQSKFADSDAVRKSVNKLVRLNNSEDTTVILNTSTYITGGLVGSRVAENYKTYQKDLHELYNLIVRYPKPSYYVHIVMPRNLPETRGNEIWPDENKIQGIGYYYLKHNSTSVLKEEIEKSYSMVSPSQALMEWGYVTAKNEELGEDSLTLWEAEFLADFNMNYAEKEAFAEYTEKYEIPFKNTVSLFRSLVGWQKKGMIDEIVIGNDDSQLPAFISFMYQNSENNWITAEDGSAVKFSFARLYTVGSKNSIYTAIGHAYSKDEMEVSLTGKSRNVNFIFGLDEIPQIIYARDLAKRNKMSADISIIRYNDSSAVEGYDVLNPNRLIENAVNFLSCSDNKTSESTQVYLFDYAGDAEEKSVQAAAEMTEGFKSGKKIALIELYTYDIIKSGNNLLFKKLLSNKSGGEEISITELSAFSAWNTNANAIGLGLAHVQVGAIAQEITSKPEKFVSAQSEMLGKHILEDGIYYGRVREELSSQKFVPTTENSDKNSRLYTLLSVEGVADSFEDTVYEVKGKNYRIEEYKLENWGFPWNRLFDCFIKTSAKVIEE